MATAKAGKADNQTPTAPAQAGPTAEDLQTDAALAGGDPAFAAAPVVGHTQDGGTGADQNGQHNHDGTGPKHSPEQVKIKMKTVSAGPDPAKNWNIGTIRFVDQDEAESLVSANLAELA